ncbi:hypothetical protein [Desulfonatronum thioautotrophicum]|uniref:hypothetical protein n=1 Tax=Desulfonatronum thioautotrophicum TaxID=617001 RepID=UPI0006995E90|nr:hypothetical protein [Desulfonatronum thioautotrophicum]
MPNELQVGDSVVVKPGTMDPDMGFDIGGWQGRGEAVYDDEKNILIQWDSNTLQAMDYELIVQSELENLDWERMVLDISEIQKTAPRDTNLDTQNVAKILQAKLTDDPRLGEEV